MNKKHMGRSIALISLLALLCVGIVELIACSRFAPETYERIVSPVRTAAAAVADAGQAAVRAVGNFFRSAGRAVAGFFTGAWRWTAERWAEFTAPKQTPPPEETPPPSESLPSENSFQVTQPALTQLVEVDGRQVLTGGLVDMTYYCQADKAWADQPYGSDTIGPYGCGPTAMAMVVSSMAGTDMDPVAMAAWAVDHGYWARRSGSYHSIVQGIAHDFGLEAEPFSDFTADGVCEALWSGNILVALVGPGHFTERGHFIIIRGVTLGGEVLVADPNSLERSLQAWDPQIILDELSSARDHGAPMWALPVP